MGSDPMGRMTLGEAVQSLSAASLLRGFLGYHLKVHRRSLASVSMPLWSGRRKSCRRDVGAFDGVQSG